MQSEYILPKKNDLNQLKVTDIAYPLPDLKNIDESKAVVIGK